MYKYNDWIIKDFLCRSYKTLGVHRDDHDFASYYTFSLAVADDAENAQMNRVCGRDHDQRCLSNLSGAKDDGSGGDNWSHKTCKGPVKRSSITNQHPAFYRPDALPVAKPTASNHHRTAHRQKFVRTSSHLCNVHHVPTKNSSVTAGTQANPRLTNVLSQAVPDKKLSWCWQTRTTRLEVSEGHQTQYHSIC